MEWLLIVGLIVTVVLCMIVGMVVLSTSINQKLKLSLEQISSKQENKDSNNAEQNNLISHIKSELKEVREGLEKYRKESDYWYQAYKIESKEREILQEEVKEIKREIGILRYIVDKMDGKEIVRDEQSKIRQIRVAK